MTAASAFAGAVLALLATAPGVPQQRAGDVVCTVDDPRAIELSGLVATADGYVSVVDSQFDSSTVVIVYLDQACRVVRTQGYPTSPRDPEDLAVAPDGVLWVADIGDNVTASTRRPTIALWRIPPGGGAPLIHRLTYPDGPHDAEALLFDGTGSPVVITKELGDTSYVYQATRPLEPGTQAGVPMRLVGEFHPVATLPPADIGRVAELMVTGAATAPDRGRVAVRTYAAAYEWDVPDGDVAKAITTGTPRITPLPDEPQGEAISYTVDGQAFLTISDAAGLTPIDRVQPMAAPTTAPSPGDGPSAIGTVTATGAGELHPYGRIVLAVSVVGALLILLWVAARVRRRQS